MAKVDGCLGGESLAREHIAPVKVGRRVVGLAANGRAVGLECPLTPTCAGAGTEGVFFREHDDGTTDLYAGDGCWAPVGFSRCSWGEPGSDDPPGPLEVGPAACDCACA